VQISAKRAVASAKAIFENCFNRNAAVKTDDFLMMFPFHRKIKDNQRGDKPMVRKVFQPYPFHLAKIPPGFHDYLPRIDLTEFPEPSFTVSELR
jgi:hypothetical protein